MRGASDSVKDILYFIFKTVFNKEKVFGIYWQNPLVYDKITDFVSFNSLCISVAHNGDWGQHSKNTALFYKDFQ